MAFKHMSTLVDPFWEQQPGESATSFARFCTYRDLPRGRRSIEKVSESSTTTYATLRSQASAHRWRDRAAAWDSYKSREHVEWVTGQAEKVAEAQVSTATEVLYAVRRSVRHVIDEGLILDASDAAKWADVSIRLVKAAREAPDQVVAITGADGGPVQVDIPELEGLSPPEQQARMTEMLSSVARLDDYRARGETA